MADSAADTPESDTELKALHEAATMMSRCAWALIALANDDETPATKLNPFREIFLGGKRVPIGNRNLTRRPSVIAGNFAALRYAIPIRESFCNRHPAQYLPLVIVSDKSALHEGCGGRFGANWHDVAFQLFDEITKLAGVVFPLSKNPIVVSGGSRGREHLLDSLPDDPTATGYLVSETGITRLFDAIKRVLRPFDIEQMEARLRDEYMRACSERRKTAPEPTPKEKLVPPPSALQDDILLVLFKFGAFSDDKRWTASKIAHEVKGKKANLATFREPLADLVHRNLIGSKEGRGGGYWLTKEGRKRAKRLDSGGVK